MESISEKIRASLFYRSRDTTTVSPAEVIVREKWAFETSEVENELTPIWDGQ